MKDMEERRRELQYKYRKSFLLFVVMQFSVETQGILPASVSNVKFVNG